MGPFQVHNANVGTWQVVIGATPWGFGGVLVGGKGLEGREHGGDLWPHRAPGERRARFVVTALCNMPDSYATPSASFDRQLFG